MLSHYSPELGSGKSHTKTTQPSPVQHN